MTFNQREYYKHWSKRNRERIRGYYYSHKKARLQHCKKQYTLHPERYRKWSWNKVVFLGKQIFVGFRQQTGYCFQCPNNIFDGTCKLTHMHHLSYIPIMIWACRIELCVSCHLKQGWKSGLYTHNQHAMYFKIVGKCAD